jgi:hypothetical protein
MWCSVRRRRRRPQGRRLAGAGVAADAREAEGGEREVEGDAYVGAAPDGLSLDRKNAFEEHTTACSAVCTKSPAASDGEAKNKSFGLIRISSANRIETLAVCNEWMCCG